MRGKLRLELRDGNGSLVGVRQASNSVMRAGGRLVADLFAGKATAGITHMGVGTSDAEDLEFTMTALSNVAVGDTPPLAGATEAAIPADAVTVIPDDTRRVVSVRVRGTLPPDAAVGLVREAGLVSRGADRAVLYNRVVFTPISKGDDHELTMFWEVSFPYGDLQTLF